MHWNDISVLKKTISKKIYHEQGLAWGVPAPGLSSFNTALSLALSFEFFGFLLDSSPFNPSTLFTEYKNTDKSIFLHTVQNCTKATAFHYNLLKQSKSEGESIYLPLITDQQLTIRSAMPYDVIVIVFFPDSTVVKHFHQKHNVFSWKLHKRFGLNYSYFTVRLKKISTFFVVHKNKWSFKLFYWWKKCFKLLIWNLNTEKDCKASQSTQNKGFETVDSFLQFKKKI